MALVASLLLIAAASQSVPPPDRFEMSVGGVTFAVEEFRRVAGEDGVTITGDVKLDVPDRGKAVLKQETKLAKDGHPLAYALDVEAPGQQVTLSARPSETGYTLSVVPKGAAAAAQTKDVSGKGPVFLIDNNVASHLDALTRSLADLPVGAERTLTVLVPQVLQALPGTVRREGDGRAVLNGAPVATRSYRLTVANVGTDLLARADDGALLSANIPMQHAVLSRAGLAAAPESGPAAGRHSSDARENAVVVKGPEVPLPATVLVPKAEGKVAGVVLLSGSGPNDKDETIGPNKPFADIARGLGDRGIASLRFDKRTLVIKDPARLASMGLTREYDDDAKAAIAQLAATPGVDPARVFVLGHSEGAMVAPRIAAASETVRGVVLLAPGVRPADEMVIDQMAIGAKLTGLSASDVADQTAELKAMFAAIRDPKRTDVQDFMGATAAYWRELLAVDVPKAVRESKLPMLVLQGDEDIQVRKDADFDLLRARVGDTGGRVTYRSFPELNHLFMKVEHGSTGAEYGFPGHVEPAVITTIADWILRH